MEISKNNNLDIIEVSSNGGGSNEVYIGIENDLDLSYIALNTSEARQIANEILKICDELEAENE